MKMSQKALDQSDQKRYHTSLIENRKQVKNTCDLQQIPGVGKRIEGFLQEIGISCIEDLKGKNPEDLYLMDSLRKGYQEDRCVLYVFRGAVYYAEQEERDPEKLKWWYWKDKEYPEQTEVVREEVEC